MGVNCMKRSDLIDLLPDNYKELCWENGAMTRHRGIQNEEELLMLVLFYALGHSLIEVKNYAKIEFNRNISDVGFMKRFYKHYPQLNSIKDYAFYYDDVKTFLCFHILEYCHRQDESEQQIS